MPSLIPDVATFERRLEGLPVVKHRAREVVLTAGSKTGALLFLRSGAVEVVKDGVQIASVSAPGSVFGELAVDVLVDDRAGLGGGSGNAGSPPKEMCSTTGTVFEVSPGAKVTVPAAAV